MLIASGQFARLAVWLQARTCETVAVQMLGSYTRTDAHPLRYNLALAEHLWHSTAHGKAGEHRMRGQRASLQKQYAQILWKKGHNKGEKDKESRRTSTHSVTWKRGVSKTRMGTMLARLTTLQSLLALRANMDL